MTPLADLARYPLKTALKRAGWTEKRYLIARSDPAFAAAADAEIASREACLLDAIAMAGATDWRAAAWLAERTAGFHEVREVAVQVQREVYRLLDVLENTISAAAFREVVDALAGELSQGLGEDKEREPSEPKRLAP